MIKVGQIGFGAWGPNLAKVMGKLPEISFSHIVECDTSRHQSIQSSFPNITCLDNYRDLLSLDLDAVIVSTPASTHYEITKELLLAGIHVFVEKPLTTDYSQAEELASLASSRGLTLMSGHVFLYHDAFNYFKKQLPTLGNLFSLVSHRNNFGRLRSDVDAWWNLAPHDVSMFLSLMDNVLPKTITIIANCFLQDGIADSATAHLKWENGVKGEINVSWLFPHKARKLVAIGSEKMLVFNDTEENKIEIHNKKIQISNTQAPIHHNNQTEKPKLTVREPLLVEMQHFFDSIKNNSDCITGAEHTLKVMKILEAGAHSIKNKGKEIELNTQIHEYSAR